MTRFLFWNVHKNEALKESLVALVHERRIDVLVLAECPNSFKNAGLLPELNRVRADEYHYSPCAERGYSGIVIYTRYASAISPIPGADVARCSFRRIQLPGGKLPVLIAAAHLPSKFNRSSEMQREDARELAEAIAEVEDQTQIYRTLLIGDMNCDPFEPGMIWAHCLHAVMTRQIARGSNPQYPRTRQTEKVRYRTFYNPMWRHYGEMNGLSSGSHYGTFYYDKRGRENLFWHILDQALLRAELLAVFRDDSLEIVTRIGDTSLLTKSGIPDKEHFSDHLPITLELEL